MAKKYTVKRGDTLAQIALKECGGKVTWQEVAAFNNISNPSFIYIGQSLNLPCSDDAVSTPTTTPVETKPTTPTPDAKPLTDADTDDKVMPSYPPQMIMRTSDGEVRINVPYYSQEDPDARYAQADCGPTSLRMVLGWHRLLNGEKDVSNPTVDDICRLIGLKGGKFSFPRQLVSAGEKYGVKLNETRDATPERIRKEIDLGRPVIMLCHYGSLPKRLSSFTGGHFLVVVGYSPTHYILNDPLWWGARRSDGAGWHVPKTAFDRAIGSAASKVGNPPHWGVVVDADGQ